MLNAISLYQKLPKLAREVLGAGNDDLTTYEEMHSGKATPKLKQVIDENNFVVGCGRDSSTSKVKPSTVKEVISSAIPKGVKSVKLFQRLIGNWEFFMIIFHDWEFFMIIFHDWEFFMIISMFVTSLLISFQACHRLRGFIPCLSQASHEKFYNETQACNMPVKTCVI